MTVMEASDANSNRVAIRADTQGRLSVVLVADTNTIQSVTALTLASSVPLQAAAAAGIRNYVDDIVCANTGASAATVTILDGATARLVVVVPANDTRVVNLKRAIRGTAATAVNASLAIAGTVTVSIQGYTGV